MSANFELASRKHYRYPFNGSCSTEDLWSLSLAQLDSVYKALRRQERDDNAEDSLLAPVEKNEDRENMFEIIKYIVAYKQEQIAAKEMEKANADTRRRIQEVLYDQENETLRNMSRDQLVAMLAKLQ